jgi:hypothetical protein
LIDRYGYIYKTRLNFPEFKTYFVFPRFQYQGGTFGQKTPHIDAGKNAGEENHQEKREKNK